MIASSAMPGPVTLLRFLFIISRRYSTIHRNSGFAKDLLYSLGPRAFQQRKKKTLKDSYGGIYLLTTDLKKISTHSRHFHAPQSVRYPRSPCDQKSNMFPRQFYIQRLKRRAKMVRLSLFGLVESYFACACIENERTPRPRQNRSPW